MGGLAWGPWRCSVAESHLGVGPYHSESIREAMTAELAAAHPRPGNHFKVELATRLAVALLAEDAE
jgi:xanthine dehydrogenase YagS FAD-binding subunit